MRYGTARCGAAAAALLALSACEDVAGGGARVAPPPPAIAVPDAPPPPSAASLALRAHYGRVERELIAQGLLRDDGGGPDTPFTARMLGENFIRIALYDEYALSGGRLVSRNTESRLRRWESPIRMRAGFGDSLTPAEQAAERAGVAAYADRLSRLSGLPIRQVSSDANFDVLFLSEDERRAAGPRLRALVPGISDTAVTTITGMPRETFCLVFAFSEGDSDVYTRALAVIRTEHPPRLRKSCVHEELAQAMGLANDSPAARPSIFNDDEEFGLLTTHDELLLRMLYDPRLRPGMTPGDARPIVMRIAEELMGDGTS